MLVFLCADHSELWLIHIDEVSIVCYQLLWLLPGRQFELFVMLHESLLEKSLINLLYAVIRNVLLFANQFDLSISILVFVLNLILYTSVPETFMKRSLFEF